ncbi:MAG: serine hydrolase, partial [Xanthomonadales bacterium]|nr:serine hydrolase [Xanthomonadales bacterium]
ERPRARGYTVDSELIRTVGLDPALTADDDGLIDTTEAQERSDAAAGLISTMPDLARFARALTMGSLRSDQGRAIVLRTAEDASEGGTLGTLRGYQTDYGTIVAAEGDGPGTNVVWVLHLDSQTVVATATNLFGRWDENAELLYGVVPQALAAVGAIPAEPVDSDDQPSVPTPPS